MNNQNSLERLTGSNLVRVNCQFDGSKLFVPTGIIDERGEVLENFRDRSLHNGVYISPVGAFYCSKKCWSKYCED